MKIRSIVLAAGLFFSAGGGALASDIVIKEAYLVARLTGDDGSLTETRTDIVPNIAEKSCFAWVLKFEPQDRLAHIIEVLTLPSPPASWGGVEDDPFSTVEVSGDKRSATNSRFEKLDAGQLESEWCVAAGDPDGPHHFVISEGRDELAKLDFEIVKP